MKLEEAKQMADNWVLAHDITVNVWLTLTAKGWISDEIHTNALTDVLDPIIYDVLKDRT